jgi:hypothetical protein
VQRWSRSGRTPCLSSRVNPLQLIKRNRPLKSTSRAHHQTGQPSAAVASAGLSDLLSLANVPQRVDAESPPSRAEALADDRLGVFGDADRALALAMGSGATERDCRTSASPGKRSSGPATTSLVVWRLAAPVQDARNSRGAGVSRTAGCCESQRFFEDYEQADLLDAWYDHYRRVSAEQFGDATGM